MGRSGDIKRPELPDSRKALRDLNMELHKLHSRAGCPTTRNIAASLTSGFGHATVYNAFSKPELPSFDVVTAIACELAGRVRDWPPGANPEEWVDKTDRRIARLWHEARYEEDAHVRQNEPPLLSDATRGLLHALSPECSVCQETRQLVSIAAMEDPDPVPWPPGFRKTGCQPEAPNPWRLIRLCLRCQRRRKEGELTEQQLRDARSALDRSPDAARHYAAYLNQILLGAEPALDMNVAALALRIVKADPSLAADPYVLHHGQIKVDRTHGSLRRGQYECTDDH